MMPLEEVFRLSHSSVPLPGLGFVKLIYTHMHAHARTHAHTHMHARTHARAHTQDNDVHSTSPGGNIASICEILLASEKVSYMDKLAEVHICHCH